MSHGATSEDEWENEEVRHEDASTDEAAAPVMNKHALVGSHWVVSIMEKIEAEPEQTKALSTKRSCSIYKIPKSFEIHNHNAFQPQVISIGPYHYHRRKDQLQDMEQLKWRYLGAVLKRKGENFLTKCLISVKELETEARKCYSEEICFDRKSSEWDSRTFVEMMVLDGCFIVELFRRATHPSNKLDKNEPIFRLRWLKQAITTDLLMLENQIPFFILQCLFNLISGRGSSLSSQALLFFRNSHFLRNWLSRNRSNSVSTRNMQVKHLLHLLHSSCIPDYAYQNGYWPFSRVRMIPSATEIKEAGIKFKKKDHPRDFFDVTFENGEIEIPFLMVQHRTYTTWLNLIAFEHCYSYCKSCFSSYAYLMDCLINTPMDVEILSQKGIINHCLGSNKAVANAFNNIGRHAETQEFYFGNLFLEINEYYGRAWPKLQTTLKRDYFKNPWRVITTAAAILLLLLTLVQTFFAAFPAFAYDPKN